MGSREALWTRLEAASFLTRDEKRAAAGYDAVAEVDDGAEAKFDPNQPRDDHGRWTDGGGGTGSTVKPGRGRLGIPTKNPVEPVAKPPKGGKKGGFNAEMLKKKVNDFVAQYCKARIETEIPGEFRDVTLGDVIELAKGGDAAARKCIKLLKQPRFRK